MSVPVLLDSGCIVALLDRSARHHRRCAEVVRGLEAQLVTCEAVLAESCWLLRELPAAADTVLANVERGLFGVPFRIERTAGAVRALMRRYATRPMSFADACLVHLADELGTGRILTLDADFTIYRWRRNHHFENLVPL